MTKKITTIIIIISITKIIFAQNNQISLNSGYANQSFFSMQNGEILNISNQDWDLAFSTESMSATIRTNDGKGVELYTYQSGDTSSWNNINNNDINNLPTLMFNSDSSWGYGAFDVNQTGGFDYGWGVYNLQTHHLIGDSLFIIKTINGNWKKLWVKSKILGDYQIKFADLNGNNEINTTISASDYSNKNFIYFSLDNNLILDREPNKIDWDITFTKYMTLYPTSSGTFMPYSVTGVFQNSGIEVAQADNISSPFTYNDYNLHSFSGLINTIGFDWKTYQGSYVIDTERCYFVRDQGQNIWKLIFTDFEGMSTGVIKFNTELITPSPINEKDNATLAIYPNPVSKNKELKLIYDTENKNTILKINDFLGRLIYETKLYGSGLKTHSITKDTLKKGKYLVSIISDQNIVTKKLIVH